MDKKVKFYLSDSYFAQVKNKKTYELISLTILIILISTILFVYQLQAIVIFLFEKRYYLSIQYLLGKSFYERYSLYLFSNYIHQKMLHGNIQVKAGMAMSQIVE